LKLRIYRNKRGGLTIKTCKKCTEEKEISEFRKDSRNKDGKDKICKACRKQEYKDNPIQKKYYYDNIEKVSEYKSKERERNRKYYSDYAREYRSKNHESEKQRMREYRERNKELFNQHQKKRRGMELDLDGLHPEFFIDKIYDYFNEECSLTGSTEDVTLDHFIPVAWGHGGTYIGNMYPLDRIVNKSKNRFNPFVWIEWAKDEYQIDIHKWNKLIETLAALNGLNVDEFKDFVYWCEGNKRTLEDIQANPIPSLELWKSTLIMN
jgi:hypothetical protein